MTVLNFDVSFTERRYEAPVLVIEDQNVGRGTYRRD